MAGFWLTIFLLFMCILPIGRSDIFAGTGRKAPATERDVWVTVRAPAPLSCTDPGVSPPVVVRRVTPDLGDLRHRQYGPGVFELSVDPAGGVTAVRVIRGIAPTIDEKIVKAARRWTFRPATQFGQPIDCVLKVQVIIDVH